MSRDCAHTNTRGMVIFGNTPTHETTTGLGDTIGYTTERLVLRCLDCWDIVEEISVRRR